MKDNPVNQNFFKDTEWWKKHWKDMPEFSQDDCTAFKTILVHFENKDDINAFSKLINQNIFEATKSIWFPKRKKNKKAIYVDE